MEERLEKIKIALGITGDYQDETIKTYITEVYEYMLDAGVKEEIIFLPSTIGVVIRGISDLWNDRALSRYFMQRVVQLCYKDIREEKDNGKL